MKLLFFVPDWNQVGTTRRLPLDVCIKKQTTTTKNHRFVKRYGISVPRQLVFFFLAWLIKEKTNAAGRPDDPAPCSGIISRPQQERRPTALVRRVAASRLTFSTGSLHVHHPAVVPKNRRPDTRARVQASRLIFHILSRTIFGPRRGRLLPSAPGLSYTMARDMWITPLDALDGGEGAWCSAHDALIHRENCLIPKVSVLYLFVPSFLSCFPSAARVDWRLFSPSHAWTWRRGEAVASPAAGLETSSAGKRRELLRLLEEGARSKTSAGGTLCPQLRRLTRHFWRNARPPSSPQRAEAPPLSFSPHRGCSAVPLMLLRQQQTGVCCQVGHLFRSHERWMHPGVAVRTGALWG